MLPPFSALLRDADDDTWAGMIPTARESVLFRPANSFDPEKHFSPAYDGSKAEELISVPELAEHILSFLNIRDIIKTTRVCKQFRATLNSSEKLRTMTFLAPTPQKAALMQIPTHFERDYMPEDIDNKDHHFFSCRVNPLFFEPTCFYDSPSLVADMKVYDDILDMWYDSDASLVVQAGGESTRLNMYLCVLLEDYPALEIKEGPARDMVLAYQPRSIDFCLELVIRTDDGRRSYGVSATLAKNVTAGGLADLINTIWTCACDPAMAEEKSISKGVLQEIAEEDGTTVANWLESEIVIHQWSRHEMKPPCHKEAWYRQ